MKSRKSMGADREAAPGYRRRGKKGQESEDDEDLIDEEEDDDGVVAEENDANGLTVEEALEALNEDLDNLPDDDVGGANGTPSQ